MLHELHTIKNVLETRCPRDCGNAHEATVALRSMGYVDGVFVGISPVRYQVEQCLCSPDVRALTANCDHVVRNDQGYLRADPYRTEALRLQELGVAVPAALLEEIEALARALHQIDRSRAMIARHRVRLAYRGAPLLEFDPLEALCVIDWDAFAAHTNADAADALQRLEAVRQELLAIAQSR